MKNIIIAFVITATGLAACNNDTGKTEETTATQHEHDDSSTTLHEHPQTGTVMEKPTAASFPAKEIITAYLQVKNALTKDNTNDAATAGKAMLAELAKVDMKSLSKEQMKSYMDIADDLKENAEHIGANAGKLDHQREHFEILSKDVADLIKTFGSGGQTLYKDFCPMASDGKGAIWISELKEIKNPYLGGKMPDCGKVKEEIK